MYYERVSGYVQAFVCMCTVRVMFLCVHMKPMSVNICSMQQKKTPKNCVVCNGPWFPKGTNYSTVEM